MRILLALVDDTKRTIASKERWVDVLNFSGEQNRPELPDARIPTWVRYHAAIRFLREMDIKELTELPPTELCCPLCQTGRLAFYSLSSEGGDSSSAYALCVFCGRLYYIEGYSFNEVTTQDNKGRDILAGVEQKREVISLLQRMSLPLCDHQNGVESGVLRDSVLKWVQEWVNFDVLADTVLKLSPSQVFHWVMKLVDVLLLTFAAKGLLTFIDGGLLSLYETPLWGAFSGSDVGLVGYQASQSAQSVLARLGAEGDTPTGFRLAAFCRARNKVLQELLHAVLTVRKDVGIRILTMVPQLSVMLFYPVFELYPYLQWEAVSVLRNRVLPQVVERLVSASNLPLWGRLLETGKIVFIDVLDLSGSGVALTVGELIKPCIVTLKQEDDADTVYYILKVWSGWDKEDLEKAELLYPTFVVVGAEELVNLIEAKLKKLLETNPLSKHKEGDNEGEIRSQVL